MFKQEVRNQVTNDSNVVNIATKDNLDIKMWKHNYQEWLLERQDSKSYTFVNRKTKEILKLNFYK